MEQHPSICGRAVRCGCISSINTFREKLASPSLLYRKCRCVMNPRMLAQSRRSFHMPGNALTIVFSAVSLSSNCRISRKFLILQLGTRPAFTISRRMSGNSSLCAQKWPCTIPPHLLNSGSSTWLGLAGFPKISPPTCGILTYMLAITFLFSLNVYR